MRTYIALWAVCVCVRVCVCHTMHVLTVGHSGRCHCVLRPHIVNGPSVTKCVYTPPRGGGSVFFLPHYCILHIILGG